MSTNELKEMIYIIKLADKEEKEKKLRAELKAKNEREERFNKGITFQICLTFCGDHIEYGKSRELRYQSFTVDGFNNAINIFQSYVNDGRKMKIEKVRLYLINDDGSKEKYKGVHFC